MSQAISIRANDPATRRLRQLGWVTLILLAAAAFRMVALPAAPPGMTHDEADHGLTAWSIVNGARDIYFTIGYGREPLYDYATALVMAGTGPVIFTARLTSVYFSLLMIAAAYAWARRAFGGPVALLAAAGLAVGFWPVMAGRQALRSIALPALFALAVLFFWQGLIGGRWATDADHGPRTTDHESASDRRLSSVVRRRPSIIPFIIAGTLLGLTFYTYIPARVMWLAFPALAVYLAFAAPPTERHVRRLLVGTGLTLIVAAFVGAPLFFHLLNNPGLEVRIDELSAPLATAAAGDFGPLWANARGALRLFTVEGDQTWRYNIPGKPFLGPVMGVLFYAGLLIAAWLAAKGLSKNRVFQKNPGFYTAASGPGAFMALVWLGLGFGPVLVTGPGLSITQAIGMMPVLYVFPALVAVAMYRIVLGLTADHRRQTTDDGRRSGRGLWTRVGGLLALALFAALAAQTARDYFGRWANAPEVRGQYETTMVSALRWLDENGRGPAAVSTITPGRYHTPAVALLTLRNPAVEPRWFDGRQSLILPGASDSTLILPGFTPVPVELRPFLTPATWLDELPTRSDDLDRPLLAYALDGLRTAGAALAAMTTTTATGPLPANFEGGPELLGYSVSATEARPGDTLALVTAWRLDQPLPDASLFAHLVGPAEPLAVADSLGAPGEAWAAGDVLLQLHTISLPENTPAGNHPLAVGVYTRSDGRRLLTGDGRDMVTLTSVTVADE